MPSYLQERHRFRQATAEVSEIPPPSVPEVVTVKQFGAKGDGVTDDTAALTTLNSTASRLFFPPGVYILDSFTPLAGTRILLDRDATLKLKPSSAGSLLRVNAANVEVLGAGTLDGNKANQSALRDCVQLLAGGDGLVLDGVAITGAKRGGIYCVEGQAARITGLSAHRVTARLCDQYGWYLGDVDDPRLELCKAYDIGSSTLHHGMTLKTCNRATLVNPVSHRAAGIAIELVGGTFNQAFNVDVLTPGNIGCSIAGGSTYCGFFGGKINALASGAIAAGGEISAVAGDCNNCSLVGLVIIGNSATPMTRGIALSHGSNVNWNSRVINNNIRYAVRSISTSSGTRNLDLQLNHSRDPTSYHYDLGGQFINSSNNFAEGGTKGNVITATQNTFINGNFFRSLTEDGVLGVTAPTLTKFGLNFLGVTDKVDTVPYSVVGMEDGNVPTENFTNEWQFYLDAGVPKIRRANGTVLTLTFT